MPRVIVCAVLGAAVAATITLQPCFPADLVPGEQFVQMPATGNPSAVVLQQNTSCLCAVGGEGTFLDTCACAGADTAQQWVFHADGTVESVANPGQCWNAWAGGVAPGTSIGLYTCGSLRIAANDVFVYNSSLNVITGTESGLCLSTAVPPAGVCASDLDCNLNGVCTSGTCACTGVWQGITCGEMILLPVPPIQGYGMQPNLTSWGGNVVYSGGQYHLYVAEMVNHCPLSDWGSNSQVTHAVSNTAQGPYVYADTALPVWSHNPQVVAFSNSSGDFFALFHIGDAAGGNPKNCTQQQAYVSDGMPRGSASSRRAALRARARAGATLQVASSPSGPWMPVLGLPGCNNPAPMLHPNGTWFLLCDSVTLYSSPSLYGPWNSIGSVPSGGVPGTYEDAFMYLDTAGNWHVIYHVYNATTPCGACDGSLVSGHSFSADGVHWRSSNVSPFGNVYTRTDGVNVTLSTRERPKLLFDASGNPTHLINGVCGGTATCPPTPGVNCKYNYWDFTLVQPLGSAAGKAM